MIKCTCNFNEETAREIGHYKGCPCYGNKTWWQEKECKTYTEDCYNHPKCMESLKELDYKIKHKEDCMHKDCEKEINCLCDCPHPTLSKEEENGY